CLAFLLFPTLYLFVYSLLFLLFFFSFFFFFFSSRRRHTRFSRDWSSDVCSSDLHYLAHERLVVDGQDVPWWTGDGEIHASGTGGLARALAWVTGRWADRFVVEAVLRDPDALPRLLAETDLEP